MLRYAVKKAILQRIKSRTSLSSITSCNHSTEQTNPQEKSDEGFQPSSSGSFEEPVPPKREESERLSEFRNKLKEDMASMEMNRYNLMTPKDNDPLPPWPNNVNPHTGEVGGPKGPEPTRYGDWERKGICVDF